MEVVTKGWHLPPRPLLPLLAALLWTLGPAPAPGAGSEVGRPLLQNFGLRDYHAHNQNWAAAQDRRGVLYFGNKSVVLEYDGVSWRKILVDRTTYVRGLTYDPATDTVFVGAVGELGYLATDPGGGHTFVSLLDRLPPGARDFRDIRRAYTLASGAVAFVAEAQVMLWHQGTFVVWRPPSDAGPLTSSLVDGRLYVHSRSLGLQRLEGDTFTPVFPQAAFLHEDALTVLIPGPRPGDLLAGTVSHGLWTLSPDGTATPFPTGADALLRANKLRRARWLADGNLAVAVTGAGLVWLKPDGGLLGQFGEASGLQNEQILDLFNDREGGLWLCLNSGLARMELATGLTVFDAANGLKHATVHNLARVDGTMFLATGAGLYRLLPASAGPPAQGAHGERLVEGDFWSVCPDGSGGVLAAGEDGIFRWRAGTAPDWVVRPGTLEGMVLRPSRRFPGRVWLGTRQGLRSLRRVGDGWQEEGALPDFNEEIRSLTENADGTVWLGTPTRGVFRLTFAPDGPGGARGPAAVRGYLMTNGLPEDMHWTRVIPWHGGADTLFATQAGFFRHDAACDHFDRVMDYGERFGNADFMLGNVAEDTAGDLWLAGRVPTGVWVDQEIGRALRGRGGWEPLSSRIQAKVGEIENLLPENGPDGAGVVWVAGTDGMVRMEVGRRGQGVAVRGAGGGFGLEIRRAAPLNGHGAPLPLAGGSVLAPDRNGLRFDFAADTYGYGSEVRYQTRLDGLPLAEWSEPSPETGVEYSNLPPGAYTFRVRARDIDGRPSREAAFPFQVRPPWSRTWWAYAVYAALALAAVAALVRWQSGRFQRANARLEAHVARQTGELVRARDAAETANRAKSAFLANMSHELRTPLNAVLGYTQIMLKDHALSDKNRERLGVVGRSGEHLLSLINEVLDLSKIEAGKLTLLPTDFPLARLLRAAEEAFRPRALEKNIAFRLHAAPGLPGTVRADESRLRQVLFNLLGNAVKFTHKGEVALHVSRGEGEGVRFEVRDTGVGIPPEELADIFLAFHQAPNPEQMQGTGLGLAISQRLVAMFGGDLLVESTPGAGSRFWFEVPLSPVAEPVAVPAPALPSPASLPNTTVTGYEGPRRRILVVDDDENNRHVLRELLAPLGFEVEEGADGRECLVRCGQLPRVDAVLLDLRMSGVDGFQAARALRRLPAASLPKIIAVSASVFESDRQQALDAGCDDFLPKPFAEPALHAALGRALELTWITAPAPRAPSAARGTVPGEADPDQPLPAAELDALLELSRRGDILKIRRRLADVLAANPRHTRFVRPLEALAAGYQIARLRETLLQLRG